MGHGSALLDEVKGVDEVTMNPVLETRIAGSTSIQLTYTPGSCPKVKVESNPGASLDGQDLEVLISELRFIQGRYNTLVGLENLLRSNGIVEHKTAG